MKITNEYGLPDAYFEAAKQFVGGKPQVGRIRCTSLIGPPQIRMLQMEHYEEITEDCSDRLWAIFGQLGHVVMEGHSPPESLSEERLSITIDGVEVTGQADLYEDNGKPDGRGITDYKFTSAWAVMQGPKDEWTRQLNIYATLYEHAGFTSDWLKIIAFLRDWSQTRAYQSETYPQQPIRVILVPLWSKEERIEYIKGRIRLHQLAESGDCPPCTDEERWATPRKFAVMKGKNKKATRLLESAEEAEVYCEDLVTNSVGKLRAKDLRIEERPREYKRCGAYCNVNQWCPQWQEEQEAKDG